MSGRYKCYFVVVFKGVCNFVCRCWERESESHSATMKTKELTQMSSKGKGQFSREEQITEIAGISERRRLKRIVDSSTQKIPKLAFVDLWGETKQHLAIALPIIVMNLMQQALPMVSLMFVGHLSEVALSSTSIDYSITNVNGASIMMGMSCALETLCGQALGAKQYHSIGIHVQRAIFILLCPSISISISWSYMDHILVLLGQDTSIAFEAGKYTKYLIPTEFSYAFLYPMMKIFQSQSITIPMMLFSIITLGIHVFLCWLLSLRLGFGIEGAALANNISCWLNVILLFLYILLSPVCMRTRKPISREALHGIKSFLSLGISSTVMICCEYWFYCRVDCLTLNLKLSVLSICTRVSNGLGGDAQSANLALHAGVGLLMSIIDGLMRGILMVRIKKIRGLIYSNEKEIVSYIAVMMPILAVKIVLDGIKGILAGTARGCGHQKLCAYANLVAYYIGAIPSAIVMAFFMHLGAKGYICKYKDC